MKRTLLAGVLFSGLALSACGSSSSSSLPSAPSYATIQANLTAMMCRVANNTPDFVWKVTTSNRGPATICDLQNPAVNPNPPTTTVTAACAYDASKVAIGYTFDCTILDPGSVETRYTVQFQAPLAGKWWIDASSAAATEPPEEIRPVAYWEARY